MFILVTLNCVISHGPLPMSTSFHGGLLSIQILFSYGDGCHYHIILSAVILSYVIVSGLYVLSILYLGYDCC